MKLKEEAQATAKESRFATLSEAELRQVAGGALSLPRLAVGESLSALGGF
jgi:hypothetical protein